MSKVQSVGTSKLGQTLKKFVVSAFVAGTFTIYAIHDRMANTDGSIALAPTSPSGASQAKAISQSVSATATNVPPTPTDPPIAVPQIGYKDGIYTGSVTDAYYGNVQAQVIIQGGKITQVNFLDYPHDRRTSQEINSFAMPQLQQEVIQAQNLNVNIVSGATLTSEAFGQSMQVALNQAQN